jgi:hypothetical protein
MATLTDDVKLAIVRALACYDTPKQVAESIKEEFNLTVSPQQVEAYDPNKYAGRALSKKWRDIFTKTREAFLADVSQVSIANAAVRLRRIERILNKAQTSGNSVLALQALEQAAKEAGGAFTNKQRHEVAGPNGAPVAVTQTTMTVEEFDARAKRLLDAY